MTRWQQRRVLLAAAIGISAGTHAQTVDLVIHNGFEDCWSQALTKTAFLQLLQTSIDGRTGCVAPSSGSISTPFGAINYTACYQAQCSAGTVAGCPVTVHSGAFTGDFGTGDFSAPGSADDVSVPVEYSGVITGTCTVSITNITLTYAPAFYLTADGNNGDYMAYLTAASQVTINSDTVSGPPPVCSSVTATQLNPQIEAQATAQMVATLDGTAVGQSVCPLTP